LPSTEELIRNYGYRWDYEECYKSHSLSDFDKTVQKACNLAKESFDKDDEKSWLKILTCLDRLAESVHKLLTEEERRRPDKYKQLFIRMAVNKGLVVGLIVDFVIKRKN